MMMNNTIKRWISPALLLAFVAIGGGCRSENSMLGFPRRAWDILSGDTELEAVKKMENADSADQRRQGVIDLYERSYGRPESYRERWKDIASADENPLVRAMAIRTLNRCKDASATPLFVKALSDRSEFVRLEAVKALAIMPDLAAAPLLTRMLNSPTENKDVRIAAADALKHYRTLDVGRALASKLADREFGVAWQSRRSLGRLTGQDYRYDESAWLKHLTSDKPFG